MSSPTSLSSSTIRKRGSTIINPPAPGKALSDYDQTRLKESLAYADSVMSEVRNMSPLGARAIKLYHSAIKRCLDLFDTENAPSAAALDDDITLIREHEEATQYRACLKLEHTTESTEMRKEIEQLQRLSFFSRYGDALADVCRSLKSFAEAKKFLGWKTLTNYWTGISLQLRSEKAAWDAGRTDEAPTYTAVAASCYSVGFNVSNTVAIIHLYAKRCDFVHADMALLVRDGRFDDLKNQLYNNYIDVPRTIPVEEQEQTQLIGDIIDCLITRWFDQNLEPDNVQEWSPTAELRAYSRKLRDGSVSIADSYKQLMAEVALEVAKAARLRQKEIDEQKKIVGAISTADAVITASGKTMKRVASSELAREEEKVKKQRKNHTSLLNMSIGLRKFSDTYRESYGTFESPADLVADPTLDKE